MARLVKWLAHMHDPSAQGTSPEILSCQFMQNTMMSYDPDHILRSVLQVLFEGLHPLLKPVCKDDAGFKS